MISCYDPHLFIVYHCQLLDYQITGKHINHFDLVLICFPLQLLYAQK